MLNALKIGLHHNRFILAEDFMFSEDEIKKLVFPDVTNDRIFGFLTRLTMDAFFDPEKVQAVQDEMDTAGDETIVVYGSGAVLLCPHPDLLVYADMARWEIQLRMRQHLVDNLGVKNRDTSDWMLLYKQGYFVDWRVCDRLKKQLFEKSKLPCRKPHRKIPRNLFTTRHHPRQAHLCPVRRAAGKIPVCTKSPVGKRNMDQFCCITKTQSKFPGLSRTRYGWPAPFPVVYPLKWAAGCGAESLPWMVFFLIQLAF